MKTISILNLKGGCSKTFTAANMAYELHRRGFKVLLLDNDKQGNLSKAFRRYDTESISPTARLLSSDWQQAGELIQQTEYKGIDIVAANMSLFGTAWNLVKEEGTNQIYRYERLTKLKSIQEYYDYCIIDNPPDVGMNVVNALAVTSEVIVPVKIDEDALEGLEIVSDQIKDVRLYNRSIILRGVLITIYQNTDGEAEGRKWLKQQSDKYNILDTIRYSKKVAENSFMRKPIYEYSPCCAAAQDYKRFVTNLTGKKR